MNSVIKDLNDRIQGLQVEKARLNDRRASGGSATQAYRLDRLKEILEEIDDLQQQLAEAQGKAVAGAIGKGA